MTHLNNLTKFCSAFALFSCCWAAAAGNKASESELRLAEKISQKRIFDQAILWIGETPPPIAESLALSQVLEAGQTNRLKQRVNQLEEFIAVNPASRWAASLRANLGAYYRSTGRYSRALVHWEEAWNLTRHFDSGNGQRVRDYTLSGWSGLLSSLGRLDKLQELETANAGRVLCDLDWERHFTASRQNLQTMQWNPGISYRCGTFSLMNVGAVLGLPFNRESLKELPSPESGFSMSQLVTIASQNKFNLVAARRPYGNEIIVPSVAHLRQNHYAAIIEFRDGRYRVADPTFGGSKWLEGDAVNEEASGYFLVPANRRPSGWESPSPMELDSIFGKGLDYNPPFPYQPPCDAAPTDGDSCPKCKPGGAFGGGGPAGGPPGKGGGGGPNGCKKCMIGGATGSSGGTLMAGMPAWDVLEPYISVQLRDIPVSYSPSRGAEFAVRMYYGEHEDRTENYFGFGPQWSCSLLSYVHVEEASGGSDYQFTHYNATNYGLGGGQIVYSYTSNSTDSSTFTTFERVFATNGGSVTVSAINIHYPDGALGVYGLARFLLGEPTKYDYFLTQLIDSHSNTTVFNYFTNATTARLTNVIDADGRTNLVLYDSTLTNRITEIDTPYGFIAKFQYDSNGVLTNIVDAIGMTNWFRYDLIGGYYILTNLTTPYGPTTFSYLTPTAGLYYTTTNDNINRAVTVTEPNGATHLYMFRDKSQTLARGGLGESVYFLPYWYDDVPDYVPVSPSAISAPCLGNENMIYRNSFYWGPRQYARLTNSILQLSTNEYRMARMRNWLHGYPGDCGDCSWTVSSTLNMDQAFSPDGGITTGEKTWYGYAGKKYSYHHESATNNLPVYLAQRLPDGGTRYIYFEYNAHGNITLERTTNFINNWSYGEKERTFSYASNEIDLLVVTNFYGVLEAGYSYDDKHHRLSATNAVRDVTGYSYDNNGLLIRIARPSDLTTTNIYDANLRLSKTIDLEITRTNSFTWTNGEIYTHTDERGRTVTNSWDALRRLTNAADGRGAVKYVYDKLDLVRVIDRMGFTNKFSYDSVRNRTSSTDAQTNVTLYSYCNCGSLEATTNALSQVTRFVYDTAGRLTETQYPDGYNLTNTYDLLGQIIRVSDGQGSTTNIYNNDGMFAARENSLGQIEARSYDEENRLTSTFDANEIEVNMSYDGLGRLISRQISGEAESETFGYSPRGLIAYTNKLGKYTLYGYDPAGRKTAETNANNAKTFFYYTPAGDLWDLTDPKTGETAWFYDEFGRVTNKYDQASNLIFDYKYDANNRLTNRWTPAKTNTFYAYDGFGNLTNVIYSVNTPIRLQYDALNRLTNMVDSIGTTAYSYTSAGLLQSEDGPWDNDTVTLLYTNRLLTGLALSQPNASDWVQSYTYDPAKRLKTLTSPAGTFTYDYDGTAQLQVKKLSLPNGAYITNSYDTSARMLSTVLKNSSHATLNSHTYVYNAGNQRTSTTRTDGSTVDYTYDPIGQLKTAFGTEPGATTNRWHERLSYVYDDNGNVHYRTNHSLLETFNTDVLNELTTATRSGRLTVAGTTTSAATNVTVNTSNSTRYADNTFVSTNHDLLNGTNIFTAIAKDNYGRNDTNTVECYLPSTATFTYDLNGNLLSDGRRAFDYDDENQLIRVTVTNAFRSEFSYDGKMRRRIRREYSWHLGAWRMTNEVRYVYDRKLVIQERDANNLPQIAYTRGKDLGKPARGVGGLLALSQFCSVNPQHSFYHADGNGNVTALINTLQLMVAKYIYDPYGNTISMSGPMSDANPFRFGSQMAHSVSGTVSFLYRYYDSSLHRWLNRDPMLERGGINLFGYVFNNPISGIDPLGLLWMPPVHPPPLPQLIADECILGPSAGPVILGTVVLGGAIFIIENLIPPAPPASNPGPIITYPPGTPNTPPQSISCPQKPDPICYFDPKAPPFPSLSDPQPNLIPWEITDPKHRDALRSCEGECATDPQFDKCVENCMRRNGYDFPPGKTIQ